MRPALLLSCWPYALHTDDHETGISLHGALRLPASSPHSTADMVPLTLLWVEAMTTAEEANGSPHNIHMEVAVADGDTAGGWEGGKEEGWQLGVRD